MWFSQKYQELHVSILFAFSSGLVNKGKDDDFLHHVVFLNQIASVMKEMNDLCLVQV